MHAVEVTTGVLATLNKHHFGGLAGIVLGAVLVVVGGLRVLGKTAGAALVPLVGLAVVILGILLYTRKI